MFFLVFTVLVLGYCWWLGDMSVRSKAIWTVVGLVMLVLSYLIPFVGFILMPTYALTLYFTVFGTGPGNRYRP